MTKYWSGGWVEPCPGRGAAFFMPLRKGYALRYVRGTQAYFSDTFSGLTAFAPATRT
jgi:hypothetical protein